ncbi:MAG TPA: formimidoylglutamate deiminase [Burkholderiaceae bacterium]|nr:formimidoylglutamate deiminase [Burkholderiaceae bacterium]
MDATATTLFAEHALLPHGWARDVRLAWDHDGVLAEVRPGAEAMPGEARAAGPLLPGMPNLHSHAFQRAFAGLTEYRSGGAADSFWTWRDTMYRFALAVSPDQLEAIATQLYIEMLRAGYTSVCEFHYLHHDPRGAPYADPAEMSLRLIAAAETAGIALTLLPVLYQHAGFGGLPPRADQRRFINSVDGFLAIVQRCLAHGARTGIAPHSLRAVGLTALRAALDGVNALDASAPIHIHIAEQQAEVDDCLAWSGARPVQWLLENAPVDPRWCLVHATHMTSDESHRLAARGAIAGLCPSTEANLGDGVFDAPTFMGAGGRFGIGSDSHVSVSVVDELRLLEYSQRLMHRQRNVLASATQGDVAQRLWQAAAEGGAKAAAQPTGALAVGRRADFVVLDADGAQAELSAPQQLANAVFVVHGSCAVRDVWVAGRQRVAEGLHAAAARAQTAFAKARSQLLTAA